MLIMDSLKNCNFSFQFALRIYQSSVETERLILILFYLLTPLTSLIVIFPIQNSKFYIVKYYQKKKQKKNYDFIYTYIHVYVVCVYIYILGYWVLNPGTPYHWGTSLALLNFLF